MKNPQRTLLKWIPSYIFDKKECGCSIKYWYKSGCIIRHFCREHGRWDNVKRILK